MKLYNFLFLTLCEFNMWWKNLKWIVVSYGIYEPVIYMWSALDPLADSHEKQQHQ